jgi:single stranded DNA-binding protein
MSEEQKGPWTFAKVQIQGRAGMDGKLAYTASGKAIMTVSLAINKGPKENRRTLWLTVKAFGDLAQDVRISKGDMVTVDGNLDISTWQDRTTGAQRERTEVLADHIVIQARKEGQAFKSSKPGALPEPVWNDEDVPF